MRETDPGSGDPLEAVIGLFRVETLRISATAHLSLALPGPDLRAAHPAFPRAACPEAGRIGMACKADPGRSLRAAVGEAVELASCCAWGDEALVRARAADLGPEALDNAAILGFSAAQIAGRAAWNRRYGRHDWRPEAGVGAGEIGWIAAEDAMSGARAFVVADAVLIGRREPGDERAVAVADSNGCAAGATRAAAQAAALLELIERDAAGRWWFGRRRRPALPPAILAPWPGLAEALAGRVRPTRLLDITTDIGIPVVVALSSEPSGAVPAIGFAARLTLTEAARAAIDEMQGVETALPPWRDPTGDPLLAEWLDGGSAALPPSGDTAAIPDMAPDAAPVTGDAPDSCLATCLAALAGPGLRAWFIDMTRSAFGVPVWRAIVPGLCHYRPRFGHPRLLAPDRRDLPRQPGDGALPNPLPLLV